MNEQNWRKERDSRSLRYAGRVLNPEDWITLRADQCYAKRYDGQVAILTAANLLGRMSPAVALDIPSVPLVAPLSWVGSTLPEVLLDLLRRADPYGKFCRRSPRENDYVIHLGRTSPTDLVVHGSGWNFYCGPSPSPLADDQTVNPIGPALAAILAASEAFRTNLAAPPEKTLLNALNWQFAALELDFAPLSLPQPTLGTLWTVGAGSVGTAILYFLSLATQNFSSVLFDMDTVKIHNLDRSPLFTADDVQKKKVVVTERYLNQAGIKTIQAEPHALDESELWRSRDQGTPDVLIAAANERNVREFIENDFPPGADLRHDGSKLAGNSDSPCPRCTTRALFAFSLLQAMNQRRARRAVSQWSGRMARNKSMQRCHFCPLLRAQWPLPKSSNSACLDIPSRRTGLP